MKQIYIESYFKGFKKLCGYSLLKDHPQKEEIEKRLKVLKFFDTYGSEATREAFGVSRSTVFLWKKKLKEAEGRITSLAPLSRVPKRRRCRETDPRIISFIRDYRTFHPGVGKETIQPCLDQYCDEHGIASVSESTVGRVIKDLKAHGAIPDVSRKLSFYAQTGRFVLRKTRARQKKLRRKGYRPRAGGDLVQMDSVTFFLEGIKRYILTAYDLETGFGFACSYPSLTSLNALDFTKKLKEVVPFPIRRVQTDNGSEFGGHFQSYLKKEGIVHFHTYPRTPQSNSHIERFNRTLNEQHVRWHLHELDDTALFNQGLMEYLIWYNTEKPHKRLGRLPPLRYYLDGVMSDLKESNMLWTLTKT